MFLLALGAVVVLVGQLAIGAPRGLSGERMVGASPRRQIGWSLSLTGALLVAAGSVMVLIASLPPAPFLVIALVLTVACVGGFWWLSRRGRPAADKGPLHLRVGAWAVPLVAIIVGLATVLLELLDQSFRSWTVGHPAIVGLATSLVVVSPVALLAERWLAVKEAARWRRTALAGVETYLGRAGRFTDRANTLVIASDEEARREGESYGGLRERLERLADRRPGFFDDLASLARDEADSIGQVGLSAATAMALYPPLQPFVDRLWSIQKLLLEIDKGCRDLRLLLALGANGRDVSDQSLTALNRLSELLFGRAELLAHLFLDLGEIDDVEVPELVDIDGRLKES